MDKLKSIGETVWYGCIVVMAIAFVTIFPIAMLGFIYENTRVYFIGEIAEITINRSHISCTTSPRSGATSCTTYLYTKDLPYSFYVEGSYKIKNGEKLTVIKSDILKHAAIPIFVDGKIQGNGVINNTRLIIFSFLAMILIIYQLSIRGKRQLHIVLDKMHKEFSAISFPDPKLMPLYKATWYLIRMTPSIIVMFCFILMIIGVSKAVFFTEAYHVAIPGLILYLAILFLVFVAPKSIGLFYELKFSESSGIIMIIRNVSLVIALISFTYKIGYYIFFDHKVYSNLGEFASEFIANWF